MTIIEQITREAEALPSKERQKVLKLVRSMHANAGGKHATQAPTRKTLGKARKTLRAAKGMWRDRADLPADTVRASIELRRRLMRRGNDA